MDYKNPDYDPYVEGTRRPSICPEAWGTHTLTVDSVDSTQSEPLWHAWLAYAIDKPPTEDPLAKIPRSWAKPYHIPNLTATRAAYKPYSTYVTIHSAGVPGLHTNHFFRTKAKIESWEPNAVSR